MLKLHTQALIAALLGATGIAQAAPYGKFGTRTTKIRPANYTHPMIVSSPAEIKVWNRAVDLKKQQRFGDRLQTRRGLIDQLVASEVGVRFDRMKGKVSATLRKQVKSVSYGVRVLDQSGT